MAAEGGAELEFDQAAAAAFAPQFQVSTINGSGSGSDGGGSSCSGSHSAPDPPAAGGSSSGGSFHTAQTEVIRSLSHLNAVWPAVAREVQGMHKAGCWGVVHMPVSPRSDLGQWLCGLLDEAQRGLTGACVHGWVGGRSDFVVVISSGALWHACLACNMHGSANPGLACLMAFDRRLCAGLAYESNMNFVLLPDVSAWCRQTGGAGVLQLWQTHSGAGQHA
jgi:hypothetical protein